MSVVCACGKRFKTKNSYYSHKNRSCKSEIEKIGIYKCPFCPIEYTRKDNCIRHMKSCPSLIEDSSARPIFTASNVSTKEDTLKNGSTKLVQETQLNIQPTLIEEKKEIHIQEPVVDIPISSKNGYIYLLREREFVRLNEHTYKIGRTTNTLVNRFGDYPKKSHILVAFSVIDCFDMEKKLISVFEKEFTKKTEYGNEYFLGDVERMKYLISFEIAKSYEQN
jgi:hypothetical protein